MMVQVGNYTVCHGGRSGKSIAFIFASYVYVLSLLISRRSGELSISGGRVVNRGCLSRVQHRAGAQHGCFSFHKRPYLDIIHVIT